MFAGGTNGSQAVDVVDTYDVLSQQWSKTHLSTPRSGIAATTVGAYALFGGGDGTSYVVDIFNINSNKWTIAYLSVARQGLRAASVNNMALFAGGSSKNGITYYIIDVYYSEFNNWTIISLLTPRVFFGATVIGNMVLFGGGSNNIGVVASVEVFQGCVNDEDCDDGVFCNGPELCVAGWCNPSSSNPCLNNDLCNNTCNELLGNCWTDPGNSCNDHIFCNGVDTCDGYGKCIHPGNPCTKCQLCNETQHDCKHTIHCALTSTTDASSTRNTDSTESCDVTCVGTWVGIISGIVGVVSNCITCGLSQR